jgi:hypothetical protein
MAERGGGREVGGCSGFPAVGGGGGEGLIQGFGSADGGGRRMGSLGRWSMMGFVWAFRNYSPTTFRPPNRKILRPSKIAEP